MTFMSQLKQSPKWAMSRSSHHCPPNLAVIGPVCPLAHEARWGGGADHGLGDVLGSGLAPHSPRYCEYGTLVRWGTRLRKRQNTKARMKAHWSCLTRPQPRRTPKEKRVGRFHVASGGRRGPVIRSDYMGWVLRVRMTREIILRNSFLFFLSLSCVWPRPKVDSSFSLACFERTGDRSSWDFGGDWASAVLSDERPAMQLICPEGVGGGGEVCS